MKGDFSRSTHRSGNHYRSVRLQQGRVLLDAEWNEQADIIDHVERTTSADVIGPTGAPNAPAGAFANFGVALEANGSDLRIAPGRIYVDGILCENDRQGGVRYTDQPDLPGAALPAVAGNYAVYLDVWEHHLTAVDQHGADFPPLVDSALQGPDTATRARVVWQVKLAPVPALDCQAFSAPPAPTAMLRAREVAAADPVDDCLVPAGGGYRRLENQLYRVEVDRVADDGKPIVKWSRDNASTVSRVTGIDPTALTIAVDSLGRDDVVGFAAATWVELTDHERALTGASGATFEVASVTATSVVVKNPDNLSLSAGTNPTLRRWDGRLTLTPNTPVELESGVEIEIDAGTVAVGDYWMIPARTPTGKVEWPHDTADPPAPIFEARHGTNHHYCPLATVAFSNGAFSSLTDCRAQFPPLSAIAASDVSYDPAHCPDLENARTVQQAIDTLCARSGTEVEKAIHVERVNFFDGTALRNDTLVQPQQLAQGIQIICDQAIFQDSVRNRHGLPNPVCAVTIDLPWPVSSLDRETWRVGNFGFMGFVPLTLAAEVNADNNSIFWRPLNQPPNQVQPWLADVLPSIIEQQTHGQLPRVRGRLTLKGNFIWGPQQPDLYLDGDVFGRPGGDHVDAVLPSGNGRRGGDFELWFWYGRQ